MNKLKSVKLPLKLAQSSGLDSGAFNGCDKLNTIEFDFTTATATDGLHNLNDNVKAQLTNIYKMFAASGNSFDDNGSGGIKTPINTNFWLSSKTGDNVTTKYKTSSGEVVSSKPSSGNFSTIKSITLNGITWTANIYDASGEQSTNNNDNAITNATTQVIITGIVANNGGFKYKYTNSQGNGLDFTNSNQSQALPSNITTIKIVLNKGAAGR